MNTSTVPISLKSYVHSLEHRFGEQLLVRHRDVLGRIVGHLQHLDPLAELNRKLFAHHQQQVGKQFDVRPWRCHAAALDRRLQHVLAARSHIFRHLFVNLRLRHKVHDKRQCGLEGGRFWQAKRTDGCRTISISIIVLSYCHIRTHRN